MRNSRPQFVLTKIGLAVLRALSGITRGVGRFLALIGSPFKRAVVRFLWPLVLRVYKPLFVWVQKWKLFSHSTHRALSLLTHRLTIKVGMLGLCGIVVLANLANAGQSQKQLERFAAGSILDQVAFPDTDVIIRADQLQAAQVGWFSQDAVLIDNPIVLTGEPGESPVVSTEATGVALQAANEISKTARTRNTIETYTVQGGDTAGTIAEKFNLRVQTILDANDIADANLIKPGQELTILPIDGVKHKFKKSDTLNKLAKEYNAEVEDILDFNKVDSRKDIEVGSTIIVPDGRIAPPPAPPTPIETGIGYASVTAAVPSAPTSYAGGHIWPTTATSISSHYGYRWGGFHTGTDIDGNLGDPVWASAPGTVIAAGWNDGGYGNMVLIDHGNGTQTRYGHLDSINVFTGQSVGQGEVVGLEGTTGWSTGPHLHYECIIGGSTVNPLGNCI